MPSGHGPLRLAEPDLHWALPSICLPFVRPSLIHLPGALRSTGVTRPLRYYGSSDSCRTVVRCPAGLIASCTESSDHSFSSHPPSLRLLDLFSTVGRTAGTALWSAFHPLRQGNAGVSWASPLDCRLAATIGRIEFVSLRTRRSPPDALHLPSRGRSFDRLRQPGRPPAGTRTLLVQYTCNRTAPRLQPGASCAVRACEAESKTAERATSKKRTRPSTGN